MKKITFLLTAFIIFFSTSITYARIDLLPRIVILEDRERSGEVIILNLSQERRDFNIDTLNYRQDEEGIYHKLDTPLDNNFNPKRQVRISPKSFTLGPNGKQKVRISIRKPANLPEKEYRFHLLATSHATEEEKQATNENQNVVISTNIGLAIPVIIRHGKLASSGKLDRYKLLSPADSKNESGRAILEVTASREGSASTLGEVSVFWAPVGEDYRKIGYISNFNIFSEINKRESQIDLDVYPTSGNLRLVYSDEHDGTIYDEVDLPL